VLKDRPVSFSRLRGAAAADHRAWTARWRNGQCPPDARIGSVSRTASHLLEITSRVADLYGTPDLGNKTDAVDELVYIILSRRTREHAYQEAFVALKAAFPRWEALVKTDNEEIESIIAFSGLGRRKAASLKSALAALIDRFGSCTLEPMRDWSDDDVAAFLCTLPEVGPKSAACVMMCSLDRPAFPVDSHVGRVLERLGVMTDLGLELRGRNHKVKQRVLWDAVPPSLRYPLHVNLLVHGRTTCLPRGPRCGECTLNDFCRHGGVGGQPSGSRLAASRSGL
jgi:endonuclease III